MGEDSGAQQSPEGQDRTPRLKLLALFALVVGITIWFHRHLYLYFTEVLLIGGTLTAWSLWKALQPWVQTGVGDQKSWTIKALQRPRSTEYLAFAFVVLAGLWIVTSSIYVEYVSAGGAESKYRVQVLLDDNPFLDTLTVTSFGRVTGQPLFFRFGSRDVVFQVVDPPGYLPERRRLGPTSHLRLAVPRDFSRKKYYVLRIIPGRGVFTQLASPKEEPESYYHVRVNRRAGSQHLDDLRQGTLFAGAERSVIDWLASAEDPVVRHAMIEDYLATLGANSEQMAQVIRILELNLLYLDKHEFAEGDTVVIEVGQANAPPLAVDTVVLDSAGITNVILEARQ